MSRKFTRQGFPKPNSKEQYKHNDVVWALISKDMPYWPAQVKTGGTLQSLTRQSDTTKLPTIPIVTFNDPDLSIIVQNEQDIINERKKSRKKSKEKLQKRRNLSRKLILPFEALKKDGTPIDFDDVTQEFVKRKKLKNSMDIDECVWLQWNGDKNGNNGALELAEIEHQRIFDLAKLTKQRKKEESEMKRIHKKEQIKKLQFGDKIYDGRIDNLITSEKEGWTLNAGDTIEYWAQSKISNESILINTKIIELFNLYDTMRLKEAIPITVQHTGNPPFWDTEIEKICDSTDTKNPVYYPLNRCKFNPSKVRDEWEEESIAAHKSFAKKMKETGWGGLLYNNDRNKHSREDKNTTNNKPKRDIGMEQKSEKKKAKKCKKKAKRARKRKRLSESESEDCDMRQDTDPDSDIQILSNSNIVNGAKKMKMTFKVSATLKKQMTKAKKKVSAAPQKKKRRLNSTESQKLWEVEQIMDHKNDSDGKKQYFVKWKGYSESENTWEPIENVSPCKKLVKQYEQSLKQKSKTKSDKNKNNTIEDLLMSLPRSFSNGGKKNASPKIALDVFSAALDSLPTPTPTPKKRKRQLRGKDRAITGETPKSQRGVSINFVNDRCCPQYANSNGTMHCEFCAEKYSNNTAHMRFESGNGGFYSNDNMPQSLECIEIEIESSMSQSTFASHYSRTPSPFCCENEKKSSSKKKGKGSHKNKRKRKRKVSEAKMSEIKSSAKGNGQKMSDVLGGVINESPKRNKSNKNKKSKNKKAKKGKQKKQKRNGKKKNEASFEGLGELGFDEDVLQELNEF